MALQNSGYFPITGDNVIDGMTNGHFWQLDGSRTINFSVSNGFYGEYWNSPDYVIDGFSEAMSVFSYYANIKFSFSGYYVNPGDAYFYGSDINLSLDGEGVFFSSPEIYAIGHFPGTGSDYFGQGGDIYLNINSAANFLPSYEPGSQGWFILLHEIGHTLGLKHPHDNGGTGRPTFSQLGFSGLDVDAATIMSYNDDTSQNELRYDPATPMILDVIALQYLYGPNTRTNAGDTDFILKNDRFYKTLWDASGVDKVDASRGTTGWEIQLPSQKITDLVDTKVGWALPLNQDKLQTLTWLAGEIENAVGTKFNDRISGNQYSNVLSGGSGGDKILGQSGADRIVGGAGSDRLDGGKGNDILIGGNSRDWFIFNRGGGRDTIVDFDNGSDLILIGRGAERFSQVDIVDRGNDTFVYFADVLIKILDVEHTKIGATDFLFV